MPMWFKELTRSPEFRAAAGGAAGTAVVLLVSGSLRTGWNKLMEVYPSQAIGGLVALVLLGLLFLCLFFLVRLIIARGWVTYFSLGLPPIAVGVTSLLWPPMKNALPWVVLGMAPLLVAWKLLARRTIPNWGPPSTLLRDKLAGVDSQAGGYTSKKHDKITDQRDPDRGKVVQIGENGFVLYEDLRIPRDQGTIRIHIKLLVKSSESEDFQAGVILAAINDDKDTPLPSLVLEVDTDNILVFKYALGPEDEWTKPPLKSKEPLVPDSWYEVAVTWGPKGMKMAVANAEDPDSSKPVAHPDWEGLIHDEIAHFGLGRVYTVHDKAANNLRVSDLRVTNIQEF